MLNCTDSTTKELTQYDSIVSFPREEQKQFKHPRQKLKCVLLHFNLFELPFPDLYNFSES